MHTGYMDDNRCRSPGCCCERSQLNAEKHNNQDANARIAALEAELLRVRTTGHGAAHELDNIAVECGLGHSPKPGEVAAHVRQLREASSEFMKEHNALCDGLNKLIDEHGGWDEDLETYEAHFRKIIAAEREAVERYRNSINHIRQFFDTLSPQEVVNVCHAATHPGTKPPPYSGYLKPHQSMCEKDSELTTLKSKHKCLVAEVDAWRDWDDKISSVDAENDNSDDGVNALQVLHFARAATDAAKAREAP